MDLDGVKYIDIRKEDGSVIASIPLTEGDSEVICRNGYTVVFGFGEEVYVEKENNIYAVKTEREKELDRE